MSISQLTRGTLPTGEPCWIGVHGECRIIITQEPEPYGWHLSISHRSRYPTWDEIHHARYEYLPEDKNFMMLLPPKEEYVNLHPNCFHLHEFKDVKS